MQVDSETSAPRASLGQGAAGLGLDGNHPGPERGDEHLAVTEAACVLDVGHSAVQEAGDLEVVVGWGSVDTSGGRMGHALQSMRIVCQCRRLAILLYCGKSDYVSLADVLLCGNTRVSAPHGRIAAVGAFAVGAFVVGPPAVGQRVPS